MTSPAVALLWENWRLSRREATTRLWLGIIGPASILAGASALLPNDTARHTAANWAFGLLVTLHFVQWMSIAKLNGGSWLDGFRPGFPFHLLFPRPLRTVALVGIPMAYDAVSGSVMFLASALLLHTVFGSPFPLMPIVAWLAASRLMQMAVQWATSNKAMQWVAALTAFPMVLVLPMYRHGFQVERALVEFSFTDYVLMAAFGLTSFGAAVAGVARQRRGDTWARRPRAAPASGYPDWFVSLFRLRCPTSSPRRAQIWFELKSTGLPVLAIGLASALLHPMFFSLGGSIDAARALAVGWAELSVPTMLVLGGNAFGIRSKQGRVYATAFMATRAYETAQLSTLKLLVRTTCVLLALSVVGLSLWLSSALVSGWGKYAQGPLRLRSTIGMAIGTLTAYERIALAAVVVLLVYLMVALRASLTALRARYPRHVTGAASGLLIYGLVFVALALARRSGYDVPLEGFLRATQWLGAAATSAATAGLCWACLKERLLTPLHVGGAALVSAGFAAASATVIGATGAQLSNMSEANAVLFLSTALLPLTISLLAPLSLSRIRHT